MVAPGWNVTEPIHVLVQIIKTIEAVQFAPEEAQDFKAQIESFADSLRGLQTVLESLQAGLENETALQTQSRNLVNLKGSLDASWDYIRRCEEFSKRFNNIANTQAKFAIRTGQAGRWVWNKKHATHLSGQLESHIRDISLKLQIETFSQGQSRVVSPVIQGKSPIVQPIFDPLPPPGYMADKPSTPEEICQALTPHKLLHPTPKPRGKQLPPAGTSDESRRSHKQPHHRSSLSTSSRRWQPLATTEPTEETRHVNLAMLNQASIPSDYSHSESSASTVTQRWSFATTASEASTFLTSLSISPSIRPEPTDKAIGNALLREPTQTWEMLPRMENLQGASIVVKRKSGESLESVGVIEKFWQADLDEVQIIFTPLAKSSYRYVLKLPSNTAVIPRTEHPMSQGSHPRHCVKIPSARFIAERRSSRRRSTATSIGSEPHSPGSIVYDPEQQYSESRSELPQPKFYFESEQHNKDFQSLFMGGGIKLQVQIPISKIASNIQKESSLQNVRLFHKDRRQYLVFYANVPANKMHKEFDMMMFAPREVKATNTIRLASVGIQPRPGSQRTQSAPSELPMQRDELGMGLTKVVDTRELRGLEWLDIEFESEEGAKIFKREARYYGVVEDFLLPEMSFEEEPG